MARWRHGSDGSSSAGMGAADALNHIKSSPTAQYGRSTRRRRPDFVDARVCWQDTRRLASSHVEHPSRRIVTGHPIKQNLLLLFRRLMGAANLGPQRLFPHRVAADFKTQVELRSFVGRPAATSSNDSIVGADLRPSISVRGGAIRSRELPFTWLPRCAAMVGLAPLAETAFELATQPVHRRRQEMLPPGPIDRDSASRERG